MQAAVAEQASSSSEIGMIALCARADRLLRTICMLSRHGSSVLDRKRSLEQMVEELLEREREVAELRAENAKVHHTFGHQMPAYTHRSLMRTRTHVCSQGRAEANRLRKDLNAAYAAGAGKMMDVAMAAGVQALHDEAHHQRRALAEQAILCDEVR